MRKRPLVMAAVFFIIIEIFLLEGLNLFNRSSPSEILIEQQDKINAVVIGKIIKKEDKDNSQCLYLKNVKIIYNDHIYNESKILAYTGKNQQIKIGNIIKSDVEVECIKGPRNPGNFNEKDYYALRNIKLRAYSKKVHIIDENVNILMETLYNIRQKWKENIEDALNDKYSGILLGVLTGDKSSIDKNIKTLYSKNGIGHILAISGLHMSFIGMAVYDLLRRCNMSFFRSASWGIIILFFYCIITGNSVSAKRAFIMYMVRMGAEVTGRSYDMPISISIGILVIVTLNVRYLKDPGFLLSFGALIALAVVYPCIQKHMLCKKNKKIFNAVLPGICISVVTLPVTLHFFFEYPLYSILINLLVIPSMTVVMILGILGSIISFIIPGKFNLLLKGCGLIFFLYNKLCTISSRLPFSRIVTGKMNLIGMIVYYAVLIIFLYYISTRKKEEVLPGYIYGIVSAALLICVCFSCPKYRVISQKIDITMIDVGQGDGIYIRDDHGYNYFVDGGSTDIKNPGENRIIPFLLSKGVSTLDYCLISHGDNDHKNGIEEMLMDQNNTIKIKRIIVPDKKFWDKGLYEIYDVAKEAGVKVLTYDKGTKINKGNISIEFMFPYNDYKGPSGNEASMVFKLKYKEFSMLFTGDLEGEGEKMVENNPSLGKVNILKTAHHGSDGSTSKKFLDKTNPDIAVISCGVNNRYGHPGENTLERLKESGVKTYCTNEKGAINIVTDGKRIKVSTFLQ